MNFNREHDQPGLNLLPSDSDKADKSHSSFVAWDHSSRAQCDLGGFSAGRDNADRTFSSGHSKGVVRLLKDALGRI